MDAPTWAAISDLDSRTRKSMPACWRALARVRPVIPPPTMIVRSGCGFSGCVILLDWWYKMEGFFRLA